MKKEIESTTRDFAEEKTHFQLKKQANRLILYGKNSKKMGIRDVRTMLRSLKQNRDKAPPTKKAQMFEVNEVFKDREPPLFEYDNSNN